MQIMMDKSHLDKMDENTKVFPYGGHTALYDPHQINLLDTLKKLYVLVRYTGLSKRAGDE